MRIARVLTRLNLGGPARQTLASDPLLGARGHAVRIFCGHPEPGEGDLFETFRSRGLDVVRVPGLKRGIAPARDFLAQRRLRRELAAFRPDVVHTHASKAGTLGRAAVRRIRGCAGVARVHTFHGHVFEGYFPEAVSKRIVSHERKLAAETDRVLAVSHATADDLLRLGVVSEQKLVVVPPGIELGELLEIRRYGPGEERPASSLRSELGAGPQTVLAGVVGRLAPIKRLEWALEVFGHLRERFPDLHLAFVGDGSERGALERKIRALGEAGQERVHMLGAREDMPAVLRALDLVLLTSRNEGLPVALIEAAAAGLPAVASAVGGVEEVVVHERTGFVGTSCDELAFGVAQLLQNPEERRAMGERARLRIQKRHSAEVLAGRLEEIYRVVIQERQEQEGARAEG